MFSEAIQVFRSGTQIELLKMNCGKTLQQNVEKEFMFCSMAHTNPMFEEKYNDVNDPFTFIED